LASQDRLRLASLLCRDRLDDRHRHFSPATRGLHVAGGNIFQCSPFRFTEIRIIQILMLKYRERKIPFICWKVLLK
jgi:hypothetical protein